MSDYQNLMQESFLANQDFKEEWRRWEILDSNLKSEPISVRNARNLFFEKNNLLFSSKVVHLEQKFKENPNSSLSEVIEFLSIDIPAFRCGYAKEYFLKWLKKTKFSAVEIKELQDLILKVCNTNSFRREFRRYCRLAVKIADEDFVNKLKNLYQTENIHAKVKSGWILAMIFQNRIDLRVKD